MNGPGEPGSSELEPHHWPHVSLTASLIASLTVPPVGLRVIKVQATGLIKRQTKDTYKYRNHFAHGARYILGRYLPRY